MSWKDNEQEQEIFSGQGGDILRLAMKEGKYTIRVLGGPKLFRTHWIDSVNRSINCDGINCPVCQSGTRGSLRYVVNVIDRADGKVKIWEFGRRVKVAIQNIAEDYGDPTGYDLIVRRTGMEAENTVYTVTPAREATALTEADASLPKYDLDKLYGITSAEKVQSYLSGVIPQRKEAPKSTQASVVKQETPKVETPKVVIPNTTAAQPASVDDLPTL